MRHTFILTGLTLSTAALIAPVVVAAGASETQQRAKVDDVRSRVVFHYQDARIKESSGMETSTRFRTITYTHNDSGDTSRFFAVGDRGGTRAVFTLRGATHYDWEDMSAGPRNTLWFGDIGANASKRGDISVYRVKEPKRLKSRDVNYTRFRFKYSDGQSHNAEALLVNPVNGALMIVSKQSGGAAFYRAKPPFSKTKVNTLHRIAPAPGPDMITAGSYSPNGKRFVIRSYIKAYYYDSKSPRSTPKEYRLPDGGESLAYLRHKRGILVGKEGVGAPVYRILR